jgi:hypothetical protein
MPFELVITLFVVAPPLATAAKMPSSGAHAIAFHESASATLCEIQFTPSMLVISLSETVPVPLATATNKSSLGDQVIARHKLVTGTARETHVSLPVIVKLCLGFFMNEVVIHLVPEVATVTNKPSSGAHAIASQAIPSPKPKRVAVHVQPSELVNMRLLLVLPTAMNIPSSAAHTTLFNIIAP